MISFPTWLPLAIIQDVGWALIHFLWQGLVLAALFRAVLSMCRSPVARHNWALGALAMMAAAPVVTFLFLQGQRDYASALDTASRAEALSSPGPNNALVASVHALDTFRPMPAPTLWINWVVILWLAGVAALGLRALGGWYVAGTLRRRDIRPLPSDLLQRCYALQRRVAAAWPVEFFLSHKVSAPVVIGWFRPVVLLPLSAITGLSPQQLDALIIHELGHIQRLDAFTNILLIAVETILFYHPAIWWVGRHIRTEREHCCDDMAVTLSGDATAYIEALTLLENWRVVRAPVLAANGGNLRDRAARLLGVPSKPRALPVIAVIGLGSGLLLSLMALGICNALLLDVHAYPISAAHVTEGVGISLSPDGVSQSNLGQHRPNDVANTASNHMATVALNNRIAATEKTPADDGSLEPHKSTSQNTPSSMAATASLKESAVESTPTESKDFPASATVTASNDQYVVSAEQTHVIPTPQIQIAPNNLDFVMPQVISDNSSAKPTLKPNAPVGRDWAPWAFHEYSSYCKGDAHETVVQGANQPMNMDTAFQQRYSFFYWDCMLRNGQQRIDPPIKAPAYLPIGTASPEHPTNVSGTWLISRPPW